WATKPLRRLEEKGYAAGPELLIARHKKKLRPWAGAFYLGSALLRLDTRLLEQVRPLRHLLVDVRGQRLRIGAVGQHIGTQAGHAFLEGLVGQTCLQSGIELLKRGLGCALGRPHAVPDADFE